MSFFAVGILALVAMVGLIVLGVPIALATMLVALAGNAWVFSFDQVTSQLYSAFYSQGTEFIFVSIPMFIFMGYLVALGNIGRDLYDCLYKWLGALPGGLAISAVTTSTLFGAVVGVSAASVATVGSITLPEMQRFGYQNRLSTGAIASASTIAILMPPSLLMVLYGLWTDTSIGRLFMAGIIPAFGMTLLFCLYILGRCLSDPQVGPAGPGFTMREKLASLVNVLPIALIFIIVVGGIYVGLFTASEAAGVGAFAVLVVLLAMRRLTMARLLQASVQTARLSIMIMTVFIAVTLFSRFLVLTDVTTTLVTAITGSGLGRYAVLLLIVAMYIFLGMIMDGISTLVLTLPLVFPVITSLGFDAVWFGVLLTIIVEIGLITPPVGFNCYVLRSIATEVPLAEIFRGVAPFVVMSLAAIGLLIAFPQIALWLPSQLY
ncbi:MULTISPECIES: TRAP transporter large permease [unclassified Sulfitobacter]|jgi:tripartite ATP-independent transporter DctM subunit|uniref:TRAP transporter large permease n=1 Tax=unclassified Sulfitobacter TaxID=196795 RepID=UPI0007C37148|nr:MULTISPECIES: TRAP transporter large permease [unclassified Sulfitobacter]KZX95096.1 hypothetical protein A3721_09215 [Sulfitobacter sp. HI0023]KZZ69973.1 hypothetical protein A3764_09135 [Sulfitobacter sp. HI0129]